MTLLSTVDPYWNDTSLESDNADLLESFAFPSFTKSVKTYWKQTKDTTTASSTESTGTTTTTLGDIMGLVTESEGLAAHYGIRHPLDRMALTANGNLQRLISSYYDAPVSVVVEYCRARPPDTDGEALRIWDRRVALRVFGTTFCVATSVIRVYDPQCVAWVESQEVGLGQLFRKLNVLPTFSLQQAGMQSSEKAAAAAAANPGGGGFWREYTLECAQLSCEIHEEFVKGLWSISPLTS